MTRINVVPVKELFVPIKGFENLYEISNFGRVFSKIRKSWNGKGYKNEGNKFLKLKDNRAGYKYVFLHKNNKIFSKYIHRLVAEHFLKNDNNYKEVNHKNGNKSDNTVNNLEWCSSSYNILHRYYILGKGIRKIQCVETGEIFSTCKEADIKLKVSLGSVSKVIRGVRKNVKGYSFIVYQPREIN